MYASRFIPIRKLEELQFQMEEEAVKKTDQLKVSEGSAPVCMCVYVFMYCLHTEVVVLPHLCVIGLMCTYMYVC